MQLVECEPLKGFCFSVDAYVRFLGVKFGFTPNFVMGRRKQHEQKLRYGAGKSRPKGSGKEGGRQCIRPAKRMGDAGRRKRWVHGGASDHVAQKFSRTMKTIALSSYGFDGDVFQLKLFRNGKEIARHEVGGDGCGVQPC